MIIAPGASSRAFSWADYQPADGHRVEENAGDVPGMAATAEGWGYPPVDGDFGMFVAEIGVRTDDEVFDALDEEHRRFGQVESLLYTVGRNYS